MLPMKILFAIFLRPIVALINHQTRVRMSAACGIGAAISRVRTFIARVMNVVGHRFDILIHVRENCFATVALTALFVTRRFVGIDGEMFAALPLITPALNHVKQMRNDAGFFKQLAVFVEIKTPRIARAFGENFKNLFRGMITPDAGIDPLTFAFGRAGFADERRTKNAVTTVKPAVRSPLETV